MFKKGQVVVLTQNVGAMEIFDEPRDLNDHPEYNYLKGSFAIIISVDVTSFWVHFNEDHPAWGFSIAENGHLFAPVEEYSK